MTSINVYQPDGIWSLYVATPTVPWYGNTTAIYLATGTSLLVTVAVAFWVFRDITKAVRPVVAIQQELADISAAQLERRVPVPGTYTYEEVTVLADTVNGTLDRLEGAYERLRRFTSDASHDLRSPITAMRLQLDEALTYPQDADWPRVATTVLKGVDRLRGDRDRPADPGQTGRGRAPQRRTDRPGRPGGGRAGPAPPSRRRSSGAFRRACASTATSCGSPGSWSTCSTTPNGTPRPRSPSPSGPRPGPPSWRSWTTAPSWPPRTVSGSSSGSPAWRRDGTGTRAGPGSGWPSPGRSPRPTRAP